jgi:hypothetical protein
LILPLPASESHEPGGILAILYRPAVRSHRAIIRRFSGEVAGLGVRLANWRYRAVCKLDTGDIRYDSLNGRRGERQHFDQFLQVANKRRSAKPRVTTADNEA